jgi:hypothetical protein
MSINDKGGAIEASHLGAKSQVFDDLFYQGRVEKLASLLE